MLRYEVLNQPEMTSSPKRFDSGSIQRPKDLTSLSGE
jgi:hypothetical protein